VQGQVELHCSVGWYPGVLIGRGRNALGTMFRAACSGGKLLFPRVMFPRAGVAWLSILGDFRWIGRLRGTRRVNGSRSNDVPRGLVDEAANASGRRIMSFGGRARWQRCNRELPALCRPRFHVGSEYLERKHHVLDQGDWAGRSFG
jgi:hypothetical protein